MSLSRKKAERAHYAYIVGQVQQRLGNAKSAIASFREVIKLKPAFDMAFNAQLNVLTSEYRVGQASSASTLRELQQMAKEAKFDIYRDQIYYEMADIAFSDGDREEGIEYMRQSLAANAGNARQAAKGYRRLADLYFETQDYVSASNYFDSTLQVLPSDDPSFATVTEYRNSIEPIAASLNAIALQDSLLAIAALSPEDQRSFAAELEASRREAELAAAIAANKKAASAPATRVATVGAAGRRPTGGPGGGEAISEFFAYDSRATRRGAREFVRTWGDRQLVDNWRTLSARESLVAVDAVDSLRGSRSATSDSDLDAILVDVPNTPEAKVAANAVIEASLFALGRDYRDRLDNPTRASEALQELLRRYPNTENAAEALYLLALAQDDLGQSAAATATRDRLNREFPESRFARSLNDPDFFDEARGAERALVDFYDQTYQLFADGDAPAARARLSEAPQQFGQDHALVARFALLNATIAGKIDGREAYVDALKSVVAKYANSDEAIRARDILRLLGERTSTAAQLDQAAAVNADGKPSEFEDGTGQPHYFLAVLPKGANMSESRVKVSDYNGKYHRLEKLAVSNVSMVRDGEQTPVIVIRRFDDEVAAMKYYRSAVTREDELVGGTAYEGAVISQNNYREVLRNKSFGEYLTYFKSAYK